MKEQIKQGLYSFSSSSWDGVSDEGMEYAKWKEWKRNNNVKIKFW